MALPFPKLDSRTSQDIVDEAKRLIPKYCPEWTSHNVSDPGVAIIEIFAWMTEMMLYRINHVPDALYERFLGLVGLRLHPPSAARAAISFYLTGAVDEEVTVPEGTEVATQRTEFEESVVFVTDGDVVIRQPDLVVVNATRSAKNVVDLSVLMGSGGAKEKVFPALKTGLGLYLGFRSGLNSNIVEITIEAQSAEGLGIDASDPPWQWQVSTSDGWTDVDVDDTTGGFNHDGVVRLVVPPRHDPATLHGESGYWIRCILTETERPYTDPPILRRLSVRSVGCVSAAHHAQIVGPEDLGRSDGTPGQNFVTQLAPVLPRTSDEKVVVRQGSEETAWTEVDDFGSSSESDLHYTWDSASGRISFGPQIRLPAGNAVQHGAVPPTGGTVAVNRYRYGGGSRGNVAPGRLNVLKSSIPLIGRVVNEAAAVGGVDPETMENAKLRGPMTLRAGERAVTALDFERMAQDASPEVARVRALPPEQAGGPIRLLIVPVASKNPRELEVGDLVIPDRLHDALTSYLEPRRVLTSTVEIREPRFLGVTVYATVQTDPGPVKDSAAISAVEEAAKDALYAYVNPLSGGAAGTGWAFDAPLTVGELFTVLQAVEGVRNVQTIELFLADPHTGERVAAEQTARLSPDTLFVSYEHAVFVR